MERVLRTADAVKRLNASVLKRVEVDSTELRHVTD
jgi:hypothetical protein